ncbi:MAG: hypothetical protein OJF49_002015 [Ktedonobacterales bacterium]|nr:MAG: hypothetical protein OJF49_002015 [Ktedonobacterales bacterium]
MPSGAELVGLARARLRAEMERVPPWGSPLLWARLRTRTPEQAVSLGALVECVRLAVRVRDMRSAREVFVLLLERVERGNRRWAAYVVGRTPSLSGTLAEQAREELCQELTLHLWEQIGRQSGEKWALFFLRSLAYAQQDTARAYMRQHGYWGSRRALDRAAALPVLLSALARDAHGDGEETRDPLATVAARESGEVEFSRAELGDLRALVERLPERERIAVVLRYWQQAPEPEIARALGGVTTRTVRNYLHQAHDRLRGWYTGEEPLT